MFVPLAVKTNVSSCCLPTAERDSGAEQADVPVVAPTPLTTEGMKLLPGATFLMGGEGEEIWPADGEGPVREVSLKDFLIDECAVTNRQFGDFVAATGFVTETERFGWSFVHASQLTKQERRAREAFRVAGLEWWYRVDGANWRNPLGPDEGAALSKRWDHPVVHVTWNDAAAYAEWRGKRLPTEAEWEFACRGGLVQKLYPWGDELTPGGKHRCNIWQGDFPKEDRGDDGYRGTAPARSFKPNDYGMYNMTGNVWEWVGDWFSPSVPLSGPRDNPTGPPVGDRRVMKGGSYLCHVSYCNRYRCSARTSNTLDTSSGHLGFRCVADSEPAKCCS